MQKGSENSKDKKNFQDSINLSERFHPTKVHVPILAWIKNYDMLHMLRDTAEEKAFFRRSAYNRFWSEHLLDVLDTWKSKF